MMKLPFIPLLFKLLILVIPVLLYGFLPREALAQAPPCNVASTSDCRTSTGSLTDYCPSGQVQCQGTNANGICYTCGQTGGQGTCSAAGDYAKNPDGSDTTCGALYQPSGVNCGDVSGGQADCNVTDTKTGCKFCSTPICTPPKFPLLGQCVTNITCSTTASATGTTTGEAKSKIDSGDKIFYDRINWYLNNSIIGTTAMNQDGTGSNNFSGLAPGTAYEAKAEYFASDLSRPSVSCSSSTFTTSPSSPSTQTCTLNGKSGVCGNGQGTTPGGGQITCGSGNLEKGGSSSCTNPNYSICYTCAPKQVIPGCEASSNVSESITANNASGAITVNPGQAVNINWTPLNVPTSGQVTNCSLSGALSGAVQPTGSKPLNTQRSGTQNVFISCQYIDNNSSCNKSISNSVTVTVSPDANECPGGIAACGNNNYGNLGACSGNWTYPGNNSWNNWCRQNSASPQKTSILKVVRKQHIK